MKSGIKRSRGRGRKEREKRRVLHYALEGKKEDLG